MTTLIRSRFEDGWLVATANTAVVGFYAGHERGVSHRFTEVKSAGELLDRHRLLVRATDGHGERVVIAVERVVSDGDATWKDTIARNVAAGIVTVDGDTVRLTWNGAIRATWLLAFPIGKIRLLFSRQKSRRALATAEAKLHPPTTYRSG